MTATTAPEEISAADRVLQVLTVMARAQRALSAAELVQACGLPRSSLYRQLARLKRFGLVQEQSGLYAPGPVCLQLAIGFERSANLVQIARPFLVQLSQATQESAGLIVAIDNQAMCLAMVESPQSLRCSFAEGRSVPLLNGASALCLLAHLATAQREAVLGQHYGAGTPERAAAQARLQAIRDAGHVITLGEVDAGVWGCSAPIFGPGRRIAAALTLMAPEQRVANHADSWTQHTLSTAARIARALNNTE